MCARSQQQAFVYVRWRTIMCYVYILQMMSWMDGTSMFPCTLRSTRAAEHLASCFSSLCERDSDTTVLIQVERKAPNTAPRLIGVAEETSRASDSQLQSGGYRRLRKMACKQATGTWEAQRSPGLGQGYHRIPAFSWSCSRSWSRPHPTANNGFGF